MKTKSDWIFLPIYPKQYEEVLIAYKCNVVPVQAYWDGKYWKGSTEVTDWMCNIDNIDRKLIDQDRIYAWIKLPLVPYL